MHSTPNPNPTEESILDVWQIALEQQKSKLQACQETSHLSSCMPCPQLLTCDLRDSYIKAVYESMSKGEGGGFEF